MNRRSTPQKKIDDAAFPVRVKVEVPELGFGRLADDMHAWLVREVGRGDYAWHSAGQIGLDAVAFYFRDTETADRFLANLASRSLMAR